MSTLKDALRIWSKSLRGHCERQLEREWAGGGVDVSHRKQCTKGKPQNVKAEIKFTSKKKDKRKAKSKSNM